MKLKQLVRLAALIACCHLSTAQAADSSTSQIEGHYATTRVNSNILNYYIAHGAAELGHAFDEGTSKYVRFLSGGGFAVRAQDFTGGSHKAVTLFDTEGPSPWYMNRICVPFNNPQFDVQYGGAHDMDVKTDLGTPITSIVNGTVSSVTHPTWGWQIGLKLDQPIHHADYFAYLHLGAVKPGLAAGQRIRFGDLIAYSGGANSKEQVGDKTNTPFGPQFIDAPAQSSQPQTGFALMRGPEYGVGAGWTKLPDPVLDPTPTLKAVQDQYRAKSFTFEVNDIHGMRTFYNTHGSIAVFGPPIESERATANGTQQAFAKAILAWNPSTGIAIEMPQENAPK